MTREEIRALVELGTEDAAKKIADELLPAHERRNRIAKIAEWWGEWYQYIIGGILGLAFISILVVGAISSVREQARLATACLKDDNADACKGCIQRETSDAVKSQCIDRLAELAKRD